MSAQGLKHAGDNNPVDTKPGDRRRGAAGRAAALRRAPSDSDCSGETASLSADSGERRPAPPPPRSGKTRSRRRGSEWEVLEGLKDGQRFERRPEVFNGYLHKKRKWPLKGWHKRFFVVDGGILVYARSPTDVARGRLHGSLDVGLSVISAKPRRRRIDIDADEFIYHLRAKTPDVFRTWLNVLKAHRLYRQHLLTFGARESVPKILDEQPPTDTSSRISHSSLESFSTVTTTSRSSRIPTLTGSPTFQFPTSHIESSVYDKTSQNTLKDWIPKESSGLLPLRLETIDVDKFDLKFKNPIKRSSLCSMCCIEKKIRNDCFRQHPAPVGTDETQMHSTNLDLRMLKTAAPDFQSSLLGEFTLNTYTNNSKNRPAKAMLSKSPLNCFQSFRKEKTPQQFGDKNATAMFFSTRKKHGSVDGQWLMKRSKKSTNLYKYRNSMEEPLLARPFSRSMLLGKYKVNIPKVVVDTGKKENKSVICDILPQEDPLQLENKSIQDTMTSSEYDDITEKLILTLFDDKTSETSMYKKNKANSKVMFYISEVVKELYNVKLSQCEAYPVQFLFRSLLEYWLKNTGSETLKHTLFETKAIEKQSNKCFTKDAQLSSELITCMTKETQVFERSIEIDKPLYKVCSPKKSQPPEKPCKDKKKHDTSTPRPNTDSFQKERRIQELERLLKNTVYICETVQSTQSREQDIKITKTLIHNLDKLSKKSVVREGSDDKHHISDASAEIPKIQETIDRLISDTDLPPEIAKEFLNVYLDVLLHDHSSGTVTSTSQSSDNSKMFKNIGDGSPVGDVQTESVLKKVSKSVTTTTFDKLEKPSFNGDDHSKNQNIDSGQLYLKEMLDKITSLFSRVRKVNSKVKQNVTDSKCDERKKSPVDVVLETSTETYRDLIYENREEKSVVIDLSKYDLERISMVNEVTSTGVVSIMIKLKEKPADFGECKLKNLSLKFSKDRPQPVQVNKSVPWPLQITTSASKLTRPRFNSFVDMKNPYINFDATLRKDKIELHPYISNSDATSKANCQVLHESEHSFDLSFRSSNISPHRSPSQKSLTVSDNAQCYLLSSFKKGVQDNEQDIRKMRVKDLNGVLKSRVDSPGGRKHPQGMTVFEKTPPKIIDEKFILLLLENLTLLSKNIPGIYKEINGLYLKLRKRHEKVIKNSSFAPGLSLLGKIYNEQSVQNSHKPMFDGETQFDATICSKDKQYCGKEAVQIAVNTSLLLPTIPNVLDKSLSAIEPFKILTNFRFQDVKNKRCNDPLRPELSKELSVETQTSSLCKGKREDEVVPTIDRAISIQNWYKKLSQECALSTVLKCLFEKDDLLRKNQIAPPEISEKNMNDIIIVSKKSPRKKSAKVRQDLIKEIKLLSPSFKVSTQAQTDRRALRHLNCLDKDCNVYQLFPKTKGNLNRSVSVESSVATEIKEKSDDLKTLYRCSSDPSFCSGLISPTAPPIRGPQAGFVSGTPGGRLASWIIESGGPLESASRELGQAQLSVQQLQRLLEALELQQQMHHDTDVSLEGASPNVKKDRRKFGLRKKKSNSKCASIDVAPHLDPSSSQMALSTLTAPPSPGGGSCSALNSAASLPIACAAARPQSLPGAEALGTGGPASLTSLTPDHQLREDFTVLAKDLVANLKTIVSTMVCERGRLRAAMEAADSPLAPGAPGGAAVAALRTNLSSALQQNSDLRSRLSRIHDASDLAEISSVGNNSDQQAARAFPQSLSYSSSCVSASEFFDAEGHEDELKPPDIAADEAGVIELDGDSSSEAGSLSSEEGSASSDNSDGATSAVLPASCAPLPNGAALSRRARLPCPRPTPASPSLWNLLYKNIGKDLSQISMPVTINEPLNMLQRLCEELEYSELLDSAADCTNEIDRMALVAAFAVSAYAASAHRAASKPFNPLLAETYECVRPDRQFRFIAEQVSHHPPISACHAESPRWTFWQEARIKTKFWGKSMEFQPTGRVHVRLALSGDHYSWNKVTTCVHNLFGGQRWVDQYGDMHIVCHGTDITCKLNFIKASSWSSSRHEVRGAVLAGGAARLRLQGRWSEGLQGGERSLWRPGAMPPDYELYYGFTRFAMELNELEPGMRELLPNTDTRLRPDQRALEEGDVEAAEQFKHELEQAQRERRRDGLEHRALWFRKTVEEGEETWVFTGEYWKAREAGFSEAPRLW